jgi:hypothetical protein
MTEATARPWKVVNPRPFKSGCLGSSGGYEISGWKGLKQLPVCEFYTRQKDYSSWTEAIEEHLNAKANAALIVKAVNHHDALVSALEGVTDHYEGMDESDLIAGYGSNFTKLITNARSILSQVRGE